MFIETSAKAGHNVKTLFRKIAQALPGMEREGEAGTTANQSELVFRAIVVGRDCCCEREVGVCADLDSLSLSDRRLHYANEHNA